MSTTEPENPSQGSALASTTGSPSSRADVQRFVPSNFPVPQPMVCKGDLPSNCKFFRQQWEDYEAALELSLQATAVRLASLRSTMGKECLQILRNLSLSPEQQNSIPSYLDALEAYIRPQRNVVYERHLLIRPFKVRVKMLTPT